MKIILLKTIDKLGRKGEVKNVSDGYARNYLLPNKLVVEATDKNIKMMQKAVQSEQVIKKKNLMSKDQLAQVLRSIKIEISEKADDNGTFFAGVTKDKLAKALELKKINIKAKQIVLDQPIKSEGEYKVEVNLDSGLKTFFQVKTTISK